jgi:hypothetical protein
VKGLPFPLGSSILAGTAGYSCGTFFWGEIVLEAVVITSKAMMQSLHLHTKYLSPPL